MKEENTITEKTKKRERRRRPPSPTPLLLVRELSGRRASVAATTRRIFALLRRGFRCRRCEQQIRSAEFVMLQPSRLAILRPSCGHEFFAVELASPFVRGSRGRSCLALLARPFVAVRVVAVVVVSSDGCSFVLTAVAAEGQQNALAADEKPVVVGNATVAIVVVEEVPTRTKVL